MSDYDDGDLTKITDYLPTVSEVFRGMKFIKQQKQNGSDYRKTLKRFLYPFAAHIMNLWQKSEIPTVTKKIVVDLIMGMQKENEIAKRNAKRQSESSQSCGLPESSNELFDIAACKCYRSANMEDVIVYDKYIRTSSCVQKIPENVYSFYIDQRLLRRLPISSIKMNEEDSRQGEDGHHDAPQEQALDQSLASILSDLAISTTGDELRQHSAGHIVFG